jgi:pumilio RNA-binding family
LDVAEHDHKVAMAKRLGHKVLRCVYDQFANHVIQKCIECVPPKDIMFIFRSFCGKAKDLSTNVYGCHVIQVGCIAPWLIRGCLVPPGLILSPITSDV